MGVGGKYPRVKIQSVHVVCKHHKTSTPTLDTTVFNKQNNMHHVSSTGKIVEICKVRAKKRREPPAKKKKSVPGLRRSSRWIQDGNVRLHSDVRLHKEVICAEEGQAGKFALYLTFDD